MSGALWAVGGRLPRPWGDALARGVAPVAALLPLKGVAAWETTIERATGRRPTGRQRRLLVENWLRNTLWSLRLARWSDGEVLATIDVSAEDEAKLHSSLAGPGLVVALPHMGSWDFAGAWAARVGIRVVSVAERLPDGLFERFRDARRGMGMEIYAVDRPELMAALAEDVRAGRLVCLLSDRDLSSRGVKVPWPGSGLVSVPAGPALLARRTGADLRVVTTAFHGNRLRLEVSDPVAGEDPEAMMRGVVDRFAAAVRRSPEDWLMLRRVFL
ncbi:LpxL/LpxP family acyltransferase [Tessaracoccus sp. G1721]